MSAAPARVRALRAVSLPTCDRDIFEHARIAVLRCDRRRADRHGRRHASPDEARSALLTIAELVAVVALNRPLRDPVCDQIMDAFTAAVGDWSNDRYHDARRACCQGGA